MDIARYEKLSEFWEKFDLVKIFDHKIRYMNNTALQYESRLESLISTYDVDIDSLKTTYLEIIFDYVDIVINSLENGNDESVYQWLLFDLKALADSEDDTANSARQYYESRGLSIDSNGVLYFSDKNKFRLDLFIHLTTIVPPSSFDLILRDVNFSDYFEPSSREEMDEDGSDFFKICVSIYAVISLTHFYRAYLCHKNESTWAIEAIAPIALGVDAISVAERWGYVGRSLFHGVGIDMEFIRGQRSKGGEKRHEVHYSKAKEIAKSMHQAGNYKSNAQAARAILSHLTEKQLKGEIQILPVERTIISWLNES